MHRYSRVEVRLDDVLKKRSRSRYWLAQQTGMTETHIGRIANQRLTGIRYETLAAICDVLDCEIADILKLVPNK